MVQTGFLETMLDGNQAIRLQDKTWKPGYKAWFPLSRLRPRQRPISGQNKAINVKDDFSTQ